MRYEVDNEIESLGLHDVHVWSCKRFIEAESPEQAMTLVRKQLEKEGHTVVAQFCERIFDCP